MLWALTFPPTVAPCAGGRSTPRSSRANVLSQTRYGGVVTACGLAQGLDLPASVAPFIRAEMVEGKIRGRVVVEV